MGSAKQPPKTIRFTLVNSRLGRMLLAATENGVCAVQFGDDDGVLENALRAEHPGATMERDESSLQPWIDEITLYLEGRQRETQVPLDVRGTPFQQRVWREVQKIPYGSTMSYGEVAEAVGRPKAVRGVGQACSKNPVAIVIPCHRVLRGDEKQKGSYSGLERRKFLVEMEKSGQSEDY